MNNLMAPQTPYLLQRRWVRWTLYLAFMTLLGLVNTGQSYFNDLTQGKGSQFVFWPTLVIGLSDWYLWFALTPVIIFFSRGFSGRVLIALHSGQGRPLPD